MTPREAIAIAIEIMECTDRSEIDEGMGINIADVDRAISKLHKLDRELTRTARDLLSIAKIAMPDTYYATDRRTRHARKVLGVDRG